MSEAAPDTGAVAPAARLRRRILGSRARVAIIASALVIWLMDAVVSRFLIGRGAITGVEADTVNLFETIGTAIFFVTLIVLIVAVVRGWTIGMLRIVAVYLAFSVVQVAISVFSMLASVTSRTEVGLTSLYDVLVMYMFSVTVFTFVYLYLDISTPRGAFVWPARDGEEPPTPNLIDYLFISLNVNATYGPTSEAVMSRPAKLIMGVQVLLAILMLTVLISRAVAATS